MPLPLLIPQNQVKIVESKITVNNQDLFFFFPDNDDTVLGTLSCLQNNKFHLPELKMGDGDVIIDIGCNVGLLSLVMAKSLPSCKVFAFDASPLATECLRLSRAENKLSNLEIFNVALGAESKKNVKFFSNGKDSSCLVGDGFNKDNKVEAATVNMISADDIFDSPIFGIENVRYLKMDIEGGEFSIFNHWFDKRQDILDRIHYLHLEIHGYEEYNPKALHDLVTRRFGDRVFFDT